MQNFTKKNLALAVEESVLSLEINGILLMSLNPFVARPPTRIGKEAYNLVAAIYKH